MLILTFAVAMAACMRPGAASGPVTPSPVFVSGNPQSIYAADPNDSWNRIFHALFTRTIKHRLSSDFQEGAPFSNLYGLGIGLNPLRFSKKKFTKTELGDRAIEPLYPLFFTNDGPVQVLSEPRFTELTTALRSAIDETKDRSPIERALMQADVWAAYDIMYRTRRGSSKIRADQSDPEAKLLNLLRQFVQKLALSSDEIKSLTNNYLDAAKGNKLPNLFSKESGWLEIELLSRRLHEDTAFYRRAARVFVKPRTRPPDPGQFVQSLKQNQHHDKIEAVALVIQNLLLDKSGRVVPSPLVNLVQLRFFKNNPKTGAVSAEPQQFELSRRKLLTEPMSGGFVEFSATSHAFLASAGNDLDFATPIQDADLPIMATLRTRCTQCHASSLTHLMTYSIHDFPPVPTVKILSDQERAFYVARRKEERDDFKSLTVSPLPR
ncbi:MAG TPA: hypothetical protein VJM50_16990 [Pyrinomonadaceae bacterium]|nr:hypothetical protein [Pyrinomonadaceae bacterium]